MAYKYSTEIKENCAKAVGVSLPISLKQSVMICSFIRGKSVGAVKKYLAEVIKKKKAVPFTRFNQDMGHKRGMAAGRFPVSAGRHILSIIESAESNAQFRGLNTSDLVLVHASAQKGPCTWRFGRHRGRKAKRAHIEIVVQEIRGREKSAKKKIKKQAKKPTLKQEAEKE